MSNVSKLFLYHKKLLYPRDKYWAIQLAGDEKEILLFTAR